MLLSDIYNIYISQHLNISAAAFAAGTVSLVCCLTPVDFHHMSVDGSAAASVIGSVLSLETEYYASIGEAAGMAHSAGRVL